MVHGGYMTVIPGDCDGVPAYCPDGAAISDVPLPVNAGTLPQSLGFGGCHYSVPLAGLRFAAPGMRPDGIP